jgi:hypothetical protein
VAHIASITKVTSGGALTTVYWIDSDGQRSSTCGPHANSHIKALVQRYERERNRLPAPDLPEATYRPMRHTRANPANFNALLEGTRVESEPQLEHVSGADGFPDIPRYGGRGRYASPVSSKLASALDLGDDGDDLPLPSTPSPNAGLQVTAEQVGSALDDIGATPAGALNEPEVMAMLLDRLQLPDNAVSQAKVRRALDALQDDAY